MRANDDKIKPIINNTWKRTTPQEERSQIESEWDDYPMDGLKTIATLRKRNDGGQMLWHVWMARADRIATCHCNAATWNPYKAHIVLRCKRLQTLMTWNKNAIDTLPLTWAWQTLRIGNAPPPTLKITLPTNTHHWCKPIGNLNSNCTPAPNDQH